MFEGTPEAKKGGREPMVKYLAARKFIQLGGLADAFDEYERRYGVTLELLRLFANYNYPVTFSTKGTWWLLDDTRYAEVMRGRTNWHVKFSIINFDASRSAQIERGVPPPSERLRAMRKFADLGAGWPILRLRPYIIGLADHRNELEALIGDAADAGAKSVSMEFMCLESRSGDWLRSRYQGISDVLGFDVFKFYQANSMTQGYLRLNPNIKRPHVERVAALCEKHRLRLYISDAHFKERSPNCACCGLPDEANVYRGQFSEALQIAKRNGVVRWSDVKGEMEEYFGTLPKNESAVGNKTNSETVAKYAGWSVADVLRECWNRPNLGHSPYKLFAGVLVPDGVDGENNVVYRYNPSRKV